MTNKRWYVQSKETILCALCNRAFLSPMIDVVVYCHLHMTRTRRRTLSTLNTFAIIINSDFLLNSLKLKNLHKYQNVISEMHWNINERQPYVLIYVLSSRSVEHQNALQNAKPQKYSFFFVFLHFRVWLNSTRIPVMSTCFWRGWCMRQAKRSMPNRWNYFNS